MIVCAGKSETFEFAYPIGIGMVVSAINLTQLCLLDKPDYLLFVGSAGSYGKHKIFDVVSSSGAANVELSLLQGKSYAPIDNVIVSEFEGVSHETIVNSSNYITTDFALAQQFERHKIGLENMEFFSVMRVAQEFNIPAAGVFIVTNYCNEEAHNDFIKNHKLAVEKLDAYVREHLIRQKGIQKSNDD